MYEKINGSVVYMDVGWSRSTAEDWTWPVSASPVRWTEDRRPGRRRGNAGSQTTDGAGVVMVRLCRVSEDVFVQFVVGRRSQLN